MVPSIVAEDGIALRVYCWLAGESGIFALADDRPVALVLLGDSWVPQNVVGAPPIHFGREEGVERTLLRVACQSETFLVPPWQGGAILHTSGAQSLPK